MKTMPFFTRENSKGAYYKIYNTVKGSQITLRYLELLWFLLAFLREVS